MAVKYTAREVNERIKDAFISVLKKTSFEKIRVKEIITAAGVSHQTFYRYYVDKYDLALQIAIEKASAFKLIYGSNAEWKEIVMSILNAMKAYPLFYKRLLATAEGSEIIKKSLLHTAVNFTGGQASEPGIAGWICIFQEWSRTDFKTDIAEVYNKILRNVPVQDILLEDELDRVLSAYEQRRLEFYIAKANSE